MYQKDLLLCVSFLLLVSLKLTIRSKFTTDPKFLDGIPTERCWFSLHSRDHELSQFKVLVCNINNTKIILRQPRSQVSFLLGTGRREPWERGWSCRWPVQSIFTFGDAWHISLTSQCEVSEIDPLYRYLLHGEWILKRCLSFTANGSSQRVMKGFINFFHIWLLK